MVNHHPAKFSDHGHCSSRDIKLLVCSVLLKEHLVKGSCNFMGRSASR